MKIEKIHLEILRNDEHFQFQTEFKDLVQSTNPETLGIKALFDAYLPLYAEEDDCFKKILKSAVTAELENADHLRDVTFRGMSDMVKTYQNHFSETMRAAAKRLKIIFDTYGNLARKTYDEETSGIYNLLQELNTTYAQDMETIGLTAWAIELQSNNQVFEQLMKERYTEQSQKNDLRMKETRTAIDRCYRNIVERIDALVVVNGEANYETFVRELNKRVERYSNTLAQRKGRSEAKKANPKDDL